MLVRKVSILLIGFASLLAVADAFAQQPDDDQTEPTLPGVEVTPPEPAEQAAEVTEPADQSQSYPSLVDQVFGDGFGGNTGILRSPGNIFDSSRAATIVPRQNIEEKQAADMFQALQNEVGVLMQSTAAGQASPFIRGLTGQQVLMLKDGIRMNNMIYRLGPNQYFNTIDPGMVDHVEVVRGPGSVLWGADAIGGVINVVTRSADLDYAACCGDYFGQEFTEYYNTSNSSSYSRLNVEGTMGAAAGVFAGGSFYNVRDLDTGWFFGRQPGTNYQQYAGDIKFNYLLDESQLLTISLQHHEQEELPRSDRFPGYPGDSNDSNLPGGARFFDPQQQDLAYFRYQAIEPFQFIDALTFTASYHRQKEAQTRGLPAITRVQERDVETVGLNLVMSRETCNFGHFTCGVDWYHDDVDSFSNGAGPIDPDDAYYERFGAFLNWNVPLTCRLSGTAGVRYELVDIAGTPIVDVAGVPRPMPIMPHYQDWVAHAGLVYEVNPCLNLVASYSEGFRPPNGDELMANNPNVQQMGLDLPSLDLTPEHAYTYEVGAKADYESLRAQVFYFWTDLQDNIVSVVPDPAAPTTFARANQDSIINGFEFAGEYLFSGGWSVYGNYWYTYGRNEITDGPLSRIPPMQGTVGLRWRDPELRSYFDIYTWLVDRQDRLDPVRDIRDERIPPGGTPGYATLNIRAGRSFGYCNEHRFSISLENITDQPYLVHGSGVFGTGFTARLGYSFFR